MKVRSEGLINPDDMVKIDESEDADFPCHCCGYNYKSPQELVNHWFEFRDFESDGIKEIFQMFVKYLFVSKKLGFNDDIELGTNMISYDDICNIEKNKDFPNLLIHNDNLKKRIEEIRGRRI